MSFKCLQNELPYFENNHVISSIISSDNSNITNVKALYNKIDNYIVPSIQIYTIIQW